MKFDWTKTKVEKGPLTEADVLVCLPLDDEFPLKLADNATAECSECHKPIQHRPNVPPQPRKMCLRCVEKLPGIETPTVTEKVAHELALYFGRPKGSA